jgi:hypothetical protein
MLTPRSFAFKNTGNTGEIHLWYFEKSKEFPIEIANNFRLEGIVAVAQTAQSDNSFQLLMSSEITYHFVDINPGMKTNTSSAVPRLEKSAHFKSVPIHRNLLVPW